MTIIRNLSLLAAATVMGAATLVATPALAHSSDDDDDRDETIRSGQCTGASDWKLKAKSDDGGIEVEAEIDSNRTGQKWAWKLKRNGKLVDRGTATTGARSGSFEIERKTGNRAGTDAFKFRAVNKRSGQVCVARVRV